MDIKVTFKIETRLSDEKIKQSFIDDFIWASDDMDNINVWSPISILPADIIPEPSLNVAHTTFIDIEYDPDIISFDELCNYIDKEFDCSAVSFKEPDPDKASDAVRFPYCKKFVSDVLEEKNMNKGKVKIGFGLTNNGYWSCEQVKAKILEYTSDANAEVNVIYPNDEFDDDFYVNMSVDSGWAYRLDFAEFMQWCEFNIVGSRPLIHGFHSESSEDGYKITFETTSVEEYDKVQAFIRGKIIDKGEPIVLFHCSCGCEFGVKKSFLPPEQPFETGLCYVSDCPACHAICRKAIEEV